MDDISLVLLDKKYSKELLKLWSDEDVMKYTYLDTLNNEQQVEYRIDFWLREHTSKKTPNNFVIMYKDKVVGVAGFPIIKKNPFCCGMYYQIMKDYQDKGIGTYIVGRMLEMIYDYYPVGKVIARCTASNIASKKILLKNGFEFRGEEKEGFERNGVVDKVEKYVKTWNCE